MVFVAGCLLIVGGDLWACPAGYTCPAGADCISDSSLCVVDSSSSSSSSGSGTSTEPTTVKEQIGLTFDPGTTRMPGTVSMGSNEILSPTEGLSTGVAPDFFESRWKSSPVLMDPANRASAGLVPIPAPGAWSSSAGGGQKK